MPSRTYSLRGPLDLRRTLAPLARGAGDQTIRLGPGRVWRATRTAEGPAAVALVQSDTDLTATAWGPGADRALASPWPARLGRTMPGCWSCSNRIEGNALESSACWN